MRRTTVSAGMATVVAGLAFLVFGARPARADFTPTAGTVVVMDRLGERDHVTFYFPRDARQPTDQVRRAAGAAGIPVRAVVLDDPTDDGLQPVVLGTTLGRRTGLFARQIDAPVLAALDVFGSGRIVLYVQPGAEVEGRPPLLHEDVFGRKFAVASTGAVTYRVPPSWLARIVAVLLVVVGLPYVALRAWGSAVERGPADDVDKVHRLRVGTTVAYLALPLVAVALVVLGGMLDVPDMLVSEVAPGMTRTRAFDAVVPPLLLMAMITVTFIAGFLGIQPVDRRLRGTDDSAVAGGRRFARGLVVALLPVTAWLVLVALIPDAGAPRLVALVVFLVLVNVLGPVLVMRAQETYRLDEPLRRRVLAMCTAQGLRVRDVRGIRARSVRMANAMITGVLPAARFVLLTDHLIDNLDDDELDAIVAHEIAHGRQHHLLLKTGCWLGLVVVLAAAVALAGGLGAVLPLVALALFVAAFLVQGRLGVRLEERADDYACRQVGVDPVVRALEKLATLNMTKRRTGALWDALQQHPGLERRIARLQPVRQAWPPA